MDRYAEKADSYTEQAEYNLCMAQCPDYKTARECGCGGSGDLPFTTVLAIFSPFIILAIVLIVVQLSSTIRGNKDKKEYEEYQRRKQLGDTKWVKEYEERRTKAFYEGLKKHEKGKK